MKAKDKCVELGVSLKRQFVKDETTGKRPIWGTLGKAGKYAYREGTAYIIFIVLFIFFTCLNPTFASGQNIMNLLRSSAPYLIAGMGIIFVMLTGGIDLSVGYIAATSACCGAMMINAGVPSGLAVIICMAIGFALGSVNGILVAKFKIFPLIITLATQMVFSGLVAVIAGKGKINIAVEDQWLNTARFLELPVAFWIAIVLIIVVWFVLNKTHFGRNVLAVGGNKECARLSGVRVDMTTWLCYALCGAFFAFAGCVVMSIQGYADTTTANGYEFTCLTAAIIGGVSMMGGKGNVMGMVVGILIMQIIGNGMQMALIDSDAQNIVKGAILLLAVAFDIFKNMPHGKIRVKKNKDALPDSGIPIAEGGPQPEAIAAEGSEVPAAEDSDDSNGEPPAGSMPPLDGNPPLGDGPHEDGTAEFKFSGGRPPADAIPPLVDVSYVKRSFLDVKYGDESDALTMDIFLPDEGEGPFPLFIHIHGGGFALGDKRDGHVKKLLDAINMGYAFASINYRLSDEAKFPAAVLDCRNAIRFLREHAEEYSIDPDRIGTIGGSAGGNLSAMLAMNIPNGEFLGEEGKTYSQTPYIKAAVDWFGPTDFSLMDKQALENGVSFSDHGEPYSAESNYMGKPLGQVDKDLIDKANPISYISDSMCPLLIEHGTVDKLVPHAQSELLYKAIGEKLGEGRAQFHDLEGADHEDKMFESDENMEIVWSFVRENL